MKVSELVPGSIYVHLDKTVIRDQYHTILGIKGIPVLDVKERVINRGYKRSGTSPIYMYLGWTYENWPLNDVYKHHWFWVNGEKIIVNNRSLRLLGELNGQL